MAYDLEEQEKIASLKAWWERYGNAVTSLVLGVAVAVAGYNVWQWYQRDRVAKAAQTYDELQRVIAAKDVAHVRELSGLLLDKYGSTAYAEMGALLAAKANLDSGDAKTAGAELQWAIDHAIDPEYRALGRVRLAGLLLDDGKFDDAAKLVSVAAADSLSAAFRAAFADRRGDILLAQNRVDDAKREYGDALALLENATEGRGYANVVQLKLDGLVGGLAVAAPAGPVTAGTPPTVPLPPAAAAANVPATPESTKAAATPAEGKKP